MPANYVLLERIELNASAASITFSNIPQSGYTDLKIVSSTRGNFAGLYDELRLRFNGSSTGYSFRNIYGNGASAVSGTFDAYSFGVGSTATANTFSNDEVYIPNYTSSNNKSWSSDFSGENNGTTAFCGLYAGLWSNTAAITSIVISLASGTAIQAGSTFSLYGLAAVGTTPAIAPKASGGNITTDGTYWYHTFLSSGTFTPATNLTCDYLVVAGGGSGGGGYPGGGGAGGLRSTVGTTGGGGSLESPISVTSNTNYTITVGAGGSAVTTSVIGNNGNNSTFSTITSIGGGGGGNGNTGSNPPGASGGSGGGGGGANTGTSSGGAGTSGQGYAGGTGNSGGAAFGGGAGGGAGGVGANGGSGNSNGATGGIGVAISAFATATNTGVSNYYAGGGAGTIDGGTGSQGIGGAGGGGNGSVGWNGTSPTPGTANTGGGGGAGLIHQSKNGQAGGSGVVIIRYAMA
jgi:hypothetical protein